MRVLVVGTGAVGGYFGGKLAARGHEVVFLARGAHGAAIRDHGLKLTTPDGEIDVHGRVIGDIAEASGLDAEVALVAVKVASLRDVAAGTGAALAPGGVAIPLENGLDSEVVLADVIGRERVIGATAQMNCRLAGPGHVRLEGGGMMTLAALDATQQPIAQRLAATFGEAFPCHVDDDLQRMLWQKLLWNAPFNAICALTRLSAGRVMQAPELAGLVERAMHEVIAVARAEGVDVSEAAIAPLLGFTRAVLGDVVPSMLQDVLAGRSTEADALQGAVVARADKHALEVPIHRTLLALMHGLETS